MKASLDLLCTVYKMYGFLCCLLAPLVMEEIPALDLWGQQKHNTQHFLYVVHNRFLVKNSNSKSRRTFMPLAGPQGLALGSKVAKG